MAQHPLTAHFVGRFAALISRNNDVVRLVAPNMSAAGFDTHRAKLAIPGRFVLDGAQFGEGVSMVPSRDSSVAEQWVVFDLTGRDVEFGNYVRSTIDLADLPSLTSAGPGPKVPDLFEPAFRLPAARKVHDALIKDVMPADAPATCRITLFGGALQPIPLRSFGDTELQKLLPVSNPGGSNPDFPGTVQLADALEWTATQDDGQRPNSPAEGLRIVMRKFDHSDPQVIDCLVTDDLVMGFSHVCTSAIFSHIDKEFEAFYRLVDNAPFPDDPVVPVLQTSIVSCSGTDCSSMIRMVF